MAIVITAVTISPNPVNVKAAYQISAAVKETVAEPKTYRLSHRLGSPKGNLSYATMQPENLIR